MQKCSLGLLFFLAISVPVTSLANGVRTVSEQGIVMGDQPVKEGPSDFLPPPVCKLRRFYFYAQADAGMVMGRAGKTQEVPDEDLVQFHDLYTDKSKTNYHFTYGLHLGLGIRTINPFFLALGVGFYDDGTFTSELHETDTFDSPLPPSEDAWYDAQYKVRLYRVMAEGKLFISTKHAIVPYVEGGVGVGTINANSFKITKLGPGVIGETPLVDHTKHNMVWQAGGGLDILLYKNFGLNFEYRYVNYGQGQIGAGKRGDSLTTGDIVVHEFVAGVSCII